MGELDDVCANESSLADAKHLDTSMRYRRAEPSSVSSTYNISTTTDSEVMFDAASTKSKGRMQTYGHTLFSIPFRQGNLELESATFTNTRTVSSEMVWTLHDTSLIEI